MVWWSTPRSIAHGESIHSTSILPIDIAVVAGPSPCGYLRGVEERDLLEQLRAGGQDAFDTIFRTYYRHLVAAAEGMLREREAAEDVAQDVMVELWRRRESLVFETSLRAYLFRAVRNR